MTAKSSLADVSILTPTYNYGHFLPDALMSVAAQRHPLRHQHVVMDGGSRDATKSLLQAIQDPAVVWDSRPDAGQSDALNRAFAAANGEWIGWLNADEFHLPHTLSVLAAAVERDPTPRVIYGDYLLVDVNGKASGSVALYPDPRIPLLYYGCVIGSCATFFHRDLLPDTPWDTSLRRIMDWDLWLRLLRQGAEMEYIPLPLAAFRVHGDQVTNEAASIFSAEHHRVRQRHGLPTSRLGVVATRSLARSFHVAKKAANGTYLKGAQFRSVKGTDLRWFL